MGNSSTTVVYDCYPSVSKTLAVAVKDRDGNSIIRSYNMRAGTDQKHFGVKFSQWKSTVGLKKTK